MAANRQGRCLCGRVRFKFDHEAVRFTAHCHCESCRRATSSPVATFIGVRDTGWRWQGEEPQVFESSPGVRRGFCGTCGSPMFFASDAWPGETHFYAASLEGDEGLIVAGHAFAEERPHWSPVPPPALPEGETD